MQFTSSLLAIIVFISACAEDATRHVNRKAKETGAILPEKKEVPVSETSRDSAQTSNLPTEDTRKEEETIPDTADKDPEQKPDDTPMPPKQEWTRYEPDSDFHNIFDGVFWRISNGFIEVRDAPRPTGSLTLVAQCLKSYGASFDKWSAALQIKVAQLYATAVTETGCVNEPGSSDGLSSGLMQVTGSTCASVMKSAGKTYSAAACKSAMYASTDFSIEVATRYINDPSQVTLTRFTPTGGTKSDRGPALDPPKVAAAYNAGALKKSSANRWHLVVTADHLERYTNAYNAFVEYTQKERQGLVPLVIETLDFAPNTALPRSVATPADLIPYSSVANEGNSIFVGDRQTKRGDFYYWIGGRWRAASERW